MKTIIVDDEQQSHEVLKILLEKSHPDIKVAASGYGMEEGLQLIETHQPDLVFLDIEMPDGTGFDLLEKIGKPYFHVVFITAHNEYAISAIRFGALDYLLKPIAPAGLARAIELVHKKQVEKDSLEQLKMTFDTFKQLQAQKLPSRMIVRTLEGLFYIPVNDIVRLEADKNTTEIIYLNAPKRLIASLHLGAYEEQFKLHQNFMRVHRSHIINLNMVTQFNRGESYVKMKNNDVVPVSRAKTDELLRRLGEL